MIFFPVKTDYITHKIRKTILTGKVYVMKKRVLLFSSITAAALMLTACNDYVGKEKSHPLYVKAAK